jgi:signal peptidase I
MTVERPDTGLSEAVDPGEQPDEGGAIGPQGTGVEPAAGAEAPGPSPETGPDSEPAPDKTAGSGVARPSSVLGWVVFPFAVVWRFLFPKKPRPFLVELPFLVVFALVLAFLIKTFLVQAFYIPSGSMQNTLAIGDRVLVDKLSFEFGNVHRGDIVVFSGDGTWDPGVTPASTNFFSRFGQSVASMFGFAKDQNDFIKRVIGLPGDKVACCDAQGRVTVNGVALNEKSYLYPGNPPSQSRFSATVPAGSLWVMGDHRDVSYDSRGHQFGFPGGGAIPESAVVGRAFVKIWPVSQFGLLSVPATFNQPKLNGP